MMTLTGIVLRWYTFSVNKYKHIKAVIFIFFAIVFLAYVYVLFVLNLRPECVLPHSHPYADCGLTIASWQYNGNFIQKILSLIPEFLILVTVGLVLFVKNFSKRSIKILSALIVISAIVVAFFS